MPKRYKDLYSILKHPKIKLKIGEKVVQTIRIKKIFIVAMMLVTTKLLVIMRVVMIMMTWMIFLTKHDNDISGCQVVLARRGML